MDAWKKVLLVTNSTTDTEINLIREAFAKAKDHGMQIRPSLVHVIPNLPTCYFNIPSMGALAEQYYEEAKQCLLFMGKMLGVQQRDQWLITGRVNTEVLSLARKLNSQFILASSSIIQSIHKPFMFKKEQSGTTIKSISNIGSL